MLACWFDFVLLPPERKMATVSPTWCYQGCVIPKKFFSNGLKISFAGPFSLPITKFTTGTSTLVKRTPLPIIKCEKTDKEDSYEEITVERPPYHIYFDSSSGQLEPASGARASIPEEEYWPEGTINQVRAARAPEPIGVSTGKPSFGKNPGSRRKKHKASASASDSSEITLAQNDDPVKSESLDDSSDESKDHSSEYVIYQTEPEEELTGYELDKKIGNPHPFFDPKAKKPIDPPLTNEELWYNWRKPKEEIWSRWQRRRPDSEAVFLKAMAETGQVKLYGDEPTETECALYRARRDVYKEERLQEEQEKLKKIGPIAYYSEWVQAWTKDTSREAVQKHFEETGEDENAQLIEMFSHQTDREYRIMMGTDVRIRRDPLAMRLREDQIKQIWGGDPVYPTVNYIQDPDETIDFRGPEFHEPTPNMLDYLKEHGKIIPREELEKILAKEKTEEFEITDMDEAMARAVDIGENDDEGENSEVEGDDEEHSKITSNWSAYKRDSVLGKSKAKPKKNDMSVEEAIEDSENLTDFLMDFDEEDQ